MRTFALPVLAFLLLPGLAGAASFTPLGDLADGNLSSLAYGVSAGHSRMLKKGELPGGGLPFFNSFAYGTSADGTVTVGKGRLGSGDEAFVWTRASGMRRLVDVLAANGATGLTGWRLKSALGISADGYWVVGRGLNPDGFTEAFLANITPTDTAPETSRSPAQDLAPAPASAATPGRDSAAAVPDSMPDPFTFDAIVGADLETLQTSNAIAIKGINTAARISVANGTYSIGCTPTFTRETGAISNGQTVCVQQTSAASGSTITSTTLTIGGVDETFTSTTVAATGGGAPDGISLVALGLLGLLGLVGLLALLGRARRKPAAV